MNGPPGPVAPRPAGRLGVSGWLHLLAVATALAGGVIARASRPAASLDGAGALPTSLFVLGVVLGALSIPALLAGLLVPDRVPRPHRLLAGLAGAALAAVMLLLLLVLGALTLGSLLTLVGDVLAVPVLVPVAIGTVMAASGRAVGLLRTGSLVLAAGASAAVWYFAAWWFLSGLSVLLLALGLEPAGAR